MSYNSNENIPLAKLCHGKGEYGIGASAVPKNPNLPTYLRITDITDNGDIVTEGLTSVNHADSSKYYLEENDIVFARTGASTGRAFFYEKKHGRLVYAGFLIKFSIDEKKVNPKYLKYYTLSEQYKGWVKAYTGGSTRGNINAKTFSDMLVELPPRNQQDFLVKFLSSLDDKIELNNKINKNLEELAQTLYKRWFVDFEFPNEDGEPYKSSGGEMVESELGLIPKGWKITQLKDIFNFIGGFAFKGNREVSDGKYKIVTIKNVQDGYMNTSTLSTVDRLPDRIKSSQILEIGDILVSLTGNVGRTCIVNLNHCLLNQRVEKVEPMIKYLKGFVYTYFRNIDTFNKMLTLSKGSAQQNLSPIEISNIIIPINIELQNLFESFNEIFQMILSNQVQIKKLSRLRDELLPRLMSGEIEVPIEE